MDEKTRREILDKISQIKEYLGTGSSEVGTVKDKLADNFPLYMWYTSKRNSLLIGSLEDEEVMLYRQENFDFGICLYVWSDWFSMLKEYIGKNGNSLIHKNLKVDQIYCLGSWVARQKNNFTKLSEERKKCLSSTDIECFQIKKNKSWDMYYEKLIEYYQKNGDFEMPVSYKPQMGLNLEIGLLYSVLKRGVVNFQEKRSRNLKKLE